MIELRPHRIQVVTMTKGGIDENGCPIPASPVYGDLVPCRFERNGKNNVIQLDDGTFKKYPFVVFLDVSEVDYENKTVRLYDEKGKLVADRKVESFQPGQLNMRLWL